MLVVEDGLAEPEFRAACAALFDVAAAGPLFVCVELDVPAELVVPLPEAVPAPEDDVPDDAEPPPLPPPEPPPPPPPPWARAGAALTRNAAIIITLFEIMAFSFPIGA